MEPSRGQAWGPGCAQSQQISMPRVRAVAPIMPAPAGPAVRLPCAPGPEEIGRTLLPRAATGGPAPAVPPARAAAGPEADPFMRRLARLD